jgi:hypothetical protein
VLGQRAGRGGTLADAPSMSRQCTAMQAMVRAASRYGAASLKTKSHGEAAVPPGRRLQAAAHRRAALQPQLGSGGAALGSPRQPPCCCKSRAAGSPAPLRVALLVRRTSPHFARAGAGRAAGLQQQADIASPPPNLAAARPPTPRRRLQQPAARPPLHPVHGQRGPQHQRLPVLHHDRAHAL